MQPSINLRKLLSICIVLFLAGLLILLWSTHSLYRFSVTGSDSYSLQRSAGDEPSGVLSLFGLSLVPKSTDFVEVRSGSSLTRHTLTEKPWFGVQTETIELQDQFAVEKAGIHGIGCDLATSTSETLYSYSCSNLNSPVIAYAERKNGDHENTPASLAGDTYVIDRKPYQDGFLSVTVPESQEVTVVHTSPTGKIINSLTLGTIDTAQSVFRLFTNTGTQSFILFNTQTNTMYTFHDGLSEAYEETPVSSLLDADSATFVVDCSVTDSQSACFFAISPEQAEQNHAGHEPHSKTPTEGILLLQKGEAEATSHSVPYGFETICLQGSALTALDHESHLYHLPTDDPTTAHLLDTNVRTLDCSGTTTAYIKPTAAFSVSGASSHLLFQMDRFSLSNIQTQYDGSIVFNTFVETADGENTQNTLHTYRVNTERPLSDVTQRLEHILPYDPTGLPILELDYDEQALYIRPQVSVTSNHATGEMIINQDSLQAAKSKIEQKLREDGILDRLEIVYF